MKSTQMTCVQWTFACYIRWWISTCSGAGKGFASALEQIHLMGHGFVHVSDGLLMEKKRRNLSG